MSTAVAQEATGTLDRALAVLACFGAEVPELGVTELAARVGVHKSTASRLATVLARRGFLTRHGTKYRLGPELARLGTLATASLDIVERARPAMERLAARTGETINLAVPDGDAALNVAQIDSSFILGAGRWVGRRTPLHAAANGKVLLAWDACPLRLPLHRHTGRTITSPARLRRELAEVRTRGYATAVQELEEGLVAVAAPVFAADGTCVASLSISGPASRLTAVRLPELGRLCADA